MQASVRAGEGPFAPDGRADRDTDDTASDFASDDGDGIGMGVSAEELLDPKYAGMMGVAGAVGAGHSGMGGEREKLHSLPDPTAPLGKYTTLARMMQLTSLYFRSYCKAITRYALGALEVGRVKVKSWRR